MIKIKQILEKLSNLIQDEKIVTEYWDLFKQAEDSLSIEQIIERLAPKSSLLTESIQLISSTGSISDTQELVEALIYLRGRPALLIKNNDFEQSDSNALNNLLNTNRKKICEALASVGRIEFDDQVNGKRFIGTGFLVAHDIIATNRHVANSFCSKPARKAGFRIHDYISFKKYTASIDFLKEADNTSALDFSIDKVLHFPDESAPDLALLRIKRSDNLPPKLTLDVSKVGKTNLDIAIIGYPAYDDRNNSIVDMNRIFKNTYDVKRLSPGKLTKWIDKNNFNHDCSTLGGNSGSPIIDITTGSVIGIHRAGDYLQSNFAVSAQHIQDELNKLS